MPRQFAVCVNILWRFVMLPCFTNGQWRKNVAVSRCRIIICPI